MRLEVKEFGKTQKKELVYLYKFIGKNIEVELLSYGGVIKSIKTPDNTGNMKNIVLGYKNIQEYEKDIFFYGCITGRVAGRTKNGILKINDEIYKLPCNENGNNLHGGPNSLNTKVWKGKAEIVDGKGILTLEYTSKHLENGFPGCVHFCVKYTIYEDSLEIEYYGNSDRDTYLNLTNHSYFNLSGDAKEDIKESYIKVNISGYGVLDSKNLPQYMERKNILIENNKNLKIQNILNRTEYQIKLVGQGIDHPFELSKKYSYDVKMFDEKTGRILSITSTEPVVVIYTGNFLDKKYNGICFEMQDYPDIFNLEPSKVKIYNKKNRYYTKTKYCFERGI